MGVHTRAQLRINGEQDAELFVKLLNSDGSLDKYYLEDATATERVNARSFLGVLYFIAYHNDETYLVNETNDGQYPGGIDEFRDY